LDKEETQHCLSVAKKGCEKDSKLGPVAGHTPFRKCSKCEEKDKKKKEDEEKRKKRSK
jgi:hypothetical protein